MTTRRQFVAGAALAVPAALAQQNKQMISLAAWSMSNSFFQGGWKLLELPGILNKKHGITALEHVNQFFETPTLGYIQKLNKACADNGVKQTILMVDGEGSTAAIDSAERKKAAIFHRKWIDVAAELGCHSVRCNFYGGLEKWTEDKDLVKRGAETFNWMLDYAKGTNLNIIVENHGRASSDPDILVALVKAVNNPKFGLLVDLGNWNPGADRYECVRKTLPYHKGLSVKGSYGPNADPAFDMVKLIKTALDGGYVGYWGIEVTPRLQRGQKLPAADLLAMEEKTINEVKAIIQQTVPGAV
jgi:sugar phosphate isomerase/epimerase